MIKKIICGKELGIFHYSGSFGMLKGAYQKGLTVIYLFFASFLIPFEIYCDTLHAIIVSDSLASNIGDCNLVDASNIRFELRQIARLTGMTLNEKVFIGDDALIENLIYEMDHLNVQEEDMVFFYFSGHGGRIMEKETQWPMLLFSRDKKYLDLDMIADLISEISPRFSIIMADCCNNYLDAKSKRGKEFSRTIKKIRLLAQGYKKLFLEMSGMLLIASSKEGQYSWTTDEGSFFTNSFIKQLRREALLEKPRWENIFENLEEDLIDLQRPLVVYFP